MEEQNNFLHVWEAVQYPMHIMITLTGIQLNLHYPAQSINQSNSQYETQISILQSLWQIDFYCGCGSDMYLKYIDLL